MVDNKETLGHIPVSTTPLRYSLVIPVLLRVDPENRRLLGPEHLRLLHHPLTIMTSATSSTFWMLSRWLNSRQNNSAAFCHSFSFPHSMPTTASNKLERPFEMLSNKRKLPNATDIASLNSGINDLRRELAAVETELNTTESTLRQTLRQD